MHPVLFHIGALLVPSYGAVAAVGVLTALVLAIRTARALGIDSNRIWNLGVLALFAALAGSRLVLLAANWTAVRIHPMWMLSLATVHHPVLAGFGALIAAGVALLYAYRHGLPYRATADVLAAPLALGLAFEQIGALLAGSGYGTGTDVPWAVVYSDAMAARWSGAPLGIPVHPVQAYAAICLFLVSAGLLLLLGRRGQNGDLAGLALISLGVIVFITEFWRDPVGRGTLFRGFLKGPQAAGLLLIGIGAALLLACPSQRIESGSAPGAPASEVIEEGNRG